MRIGPNPTRGCVDEVSLCSTPIQDRISAAPPRCSPDTHPGRESVYSENNREVVPKLHLRSEQNLETNPSTHLRAVQKTWTIQNRDGHRYAKIHIPPTVSISDGRCLTGLCTTTVSERGPLYLGWRWSQASGAVARRCCAGRTAAPTKTIGVAYILRVPSDESCSTKEEL